MVIGYWLLWFRNKLWFLFVNFLVKFLMLLVIVKVFLSFVGRLWSVEIIVLLLVFVMLFFLFSVRVSIKNVVSWVVNVLVDVMLIFVLVWVINVRFDLCINDEFWML